MTVDDGHELEGDASHESRKIGRPPDVLLLRRLYEKLLLIRMVEERIVDLYPEEEMRCPIHLSIGQEAVSAGVMHALLPEDIVMSNHRSHGHYLAKGASLNRFFAELYGKEAGCSGGRGGSMHLIDLESNFFGATPIVGGSLPIAVGIGFGLKMRKESGIAVPFLGDGTVEEGVFHEVANFAVLHHLPVLFVCENNYYSVYTPLHLRQPKGRKIVEFAKGYGMRGFSGEGNDAYDVYALTKKAADIVRCGGGPVFLEFLTYRWREHCGPNYDDHLGYRPADEVAMWKAKDPLLAFEKRWTGSIPESVFADVRTDVMRRIDEAVLFAKKSPFPDVSLLMRHVYKE